MQSPIALHLSKTFRLEKLAAYHACFHKDKAPRGCISKYHNHLGKSPVNDSDVVSADNIPSPSEKSEKQLLLLQNTTSWLY